MTYIEFLDKYFCRPSMRRLSSFCRETNSAKRDHCPIAEDHAKTLPRLHDLPPQPKVSHTPCEELSLEPPTHHDAL